MSSRPEGIDVEAAQEFLTEGRAQFVDARPHEEYVLSPEVIPAAVHIDPGDGIEMDERLSLLPRELLLIAYCDEPGHAASAQVARRAREQGRGDACVLEGGFHAWREAGAPIVANLDAIRAIAAQARAAMAASAPSRGSRHAADEQGGMQLASAAIRAGDPIPIVHTLDGDNLSPPLAWQGVPHGARSLALVMEDQDARGAGGALFTHWLLYNLQPSAGGLQLAANRDGLPPDARAGINDFGLVGYAGPRNPDGLHHYRLRLFALDVRLDPAVVGRPDRTGLLAAIQDHVLAEAELQAIYERSIEVQPRV